MKKIFAVTLLSLLAASCAGEPGVAPGTSALLSAAKAVDWSANVKLIRTACYQSFYKGIGPVESSFEIRVKNLGTGKRVFVHHLTADGSWADLPAAYIGQADTGYEIWSLTNFDYTYGYPRLSNRFCLKYTVNGATYWDNNGGADYSINANDGPNLGGGVNVLNSWTVYTAYNSNLVVNLDVRNIAYAKDVQVIYSANNWATSKSAVAVFKNRFDWGYASATSPNICGVERWVASFNTGTTNALKFYIKYTVSGQTYYDNNWTRDYSVVSR